MSAAAISVLDRALRILHLEDSPHDRELIRELLETEGFATEIIAVDNQADFMAALQQQVFDIILSDQNLPSFNGMTALQLAKSKYPDVPFIFVTGSMGEEAAIETIKDGATDYVLKERLNRLIPAVERAIREADQAHKNRMAHAALRESEERFQLIARASNDAIWDWNIETGAVWHSAGIKHFGYQDEDVAGNRRLWLDHIHPSHQERVNIGVNKILRGREQYWSDEYPFCRKDGSLAHVFNRGYVIRNAKGEAVRMVGAMMDVTQRKLAEQLSLERTALAALEAEVTNALSTSASLRESLQKCGDAVVHHLEVALARIWMLDEAGQFLQLQASAGLYTNLNGNHGRIAMGQNKIGRIAQERKPLLTNSFVEDPTAVDRDWAARENITAFAGYPMLVGEQLRGVIAVYSAKPINDFAAEALALVSREIALGIERRRAEDKIREQAALLDKAQDAIFVPGLNQQIRYWNKSAERLYGWTSVEALGQDATKLLFKEETAALREAREKILLQGEWTGELAQITKAGTEITVKSHWSLVRDQAGQPDCILIVNTDITEKKKLEAQFLRSQRLESIGALASGIAHDLNNVLSPIMMGVAYLKEQVKDHAGQEILSSIELSASRGAGIVKQVLTFARGATGEPILLQPNRLIQEIVKITAETFPKSIRVGATYDEDLWTILGDPTQIHQVLLNLCVNARDAMPNGGSLSLSSRKVMLDQPTSLAGLTGRPGPYVQIEVRDTGMGMTPEVQKRMFEPFFTTKDPGKGTGLGLSTTISILQSHGGLIDVQSTVAQGTTFILCFPAQGGQSEPEKPHKPAPRSGRHDLVLLVDDELAIREMCKLILESCDYRVLTAENGAQALALFERHKDEVAVVITDMMMPVMDGPTAIRAMRWSSPGLKVIITSGLSEKEQSLCQADLKIDSFLQKPYTSEQLLTAIADLVQKK